MNKLDVAVDKKLILALPTDNAGCGYIRMYTPLNYLNSIYGIKKNLSVLFSPSFLHQEDMLSVTYSIFLQRQMTHAHVKNIMKYVDRRNDLKYRLVYDIDDYIWDFNELQGGSKDLGVPSYNFGYKGVTKEHKNNSTEIMKVCDKITVSTEPLKDYIKNTLKVETPIEVLKNTIPLHLWGNTKKNPIKEDIKKPKVIYTGSPTHYKNPHKDDPSKKLGDFENAWKDWIIKSVKEDKIEFHCLGGLPWFFEDIKSKIKVYHWIDYYRYHLLIKHINPDFGIMPIVPNMFNQCKSDVKFIEYCAGGIVGVGTSFKGTNFISPYEDMPQNLPHDCSIEDIEEKFKELSTKDIYNKSLEDQYEILYKDRFTESSEYINQLVNILVKHS